MAVTTIAPISSNSAGTRWRSTRRHLPSPPSLDKYIILLSSGELRKFKLASSLFTDPRVLIMDNPFIGLDAETRDQLKELLATLSEERQLQIILVLSKSDEIPEFITHVVEVREMRVLPKITRETYLQNRLPFPTRLLSDKKAQEILNMPTNQLAAASQEVHPKRSHLDGQSR